MTFKFIHYRAFAAIVSGALYALSNVGFGIWPLVFICFIPLWLALDAISRNSAQKNKAASLYGFLFGLSVFALGCPWLLTLADKFMASGWLLGGLLWGALGIFFALGFALYAFIYRILRISNCPQVIAGVAPLVLLECFQTNLFPSYTGAALIAEPILAQIADLGGPLLLTAFVAVINSNLYALLVAFKQGSPFPSKTAISLVILMISVVGYGHLQNESLRHEQASKQLKPFVVGAVQTNIVMLDKEQISLQSQPAHLAQSQELLARGPVDLLIWPETAYVRGLRRPLPIDAQFIRENIKEPLLFGGTSVWQQGGQRVSANSVFLAEADGKIKQAYDKNLLIPFAEYLPFSGLSTQFDDLFTRRFPQLQRFRAGEHTQALSLNGIAISTPICYEIIQPDFIRKMVRDAHPQLLVTLANDAWFGDTQEPWIHLSLARLRAIEHHLWMVRATNSGISAIINPNGYITAQTGLNTKENLRATVYPQRSNTFYTQYGNWVAWLAITFILLGLAHQRFIMPAPSSLLTNR